MPEIMPARRLVVGAKILCDLLDRIRSARGRIGWPVAAHPSRAFMNRSASVRFSVPVLSRTARPFT